MVSEEDIDMSSTLLGELNVQRGIRSLLSLVLCMVLFVPGGVTQAQVLPSPHIGFATPVSKVASHALLVRPPSKQNFSSEVRHSSMEGGSPYSPEHQRKAGRGDEVDPLNWNIVLAGNILTGVGVAGFLLMAGGLAARHDAQERMSTVGTTSNLAGLQQKRDKFRQQRKVGEVLALSGGIAAAAFVSTGLGLMFWGRAREKQRRESLGIKRRLETSSRVFSWIPEVNISISRRRVDAMWNLHF